MQKNNPSHNHENFMHRCLELASNGLGRVAPNPMVGSLILHKGTIIGEGYHQHYGQAHAEVNAIQSVKEQELLKESILYVNLEPCAHSGKTPPCTDLIIEKKIPEVVIGTSDPYSLVAGKGIEKLKQNGVRVTTNILAEACFNLNRRFFVFHENKRPYIILKWAQTRDGFIDKKRDPNTPIGVNWISSELSKMLVHKWRAEEQGIMIGTNTAINDNPELTLREWKGRQPVRILLDRFLRVPKSNKLLNGDIKTLVYNMHQNLSLGETEYIACNYSPSDLSPVMSDLYARGISSVIVEGGRELHHYFIKSKIWDESRVFIGDRVFEQGVAAPVLDTLPISERLISSDKLLIFRRT